MSLFQMTYLAVVYLYVVFKTVFIFNRDTHDPQRPHLDKGYTIEEYMKLTMDMMAKMKDHRTVTGSPNVTQITTDLLFRYMKSPSHCLILFPSLCSMVFIGYMTMLSFIHLSIEIM